MLMLSFAIIEQCQNLETAMYCWSCTNQNADEHTVTLAIAAWGLFLPCERAMYNRRQFLSIFLFSLMLGIAASEWVSQKLACVKSNDKTGWNWRC